ncbi:MAG: hypothetical protein R3228_06830 [Halioglobus sp.]|nr:hypothetical protein [Halioglobus sp.]
MLMVVVFCLTVSPWCRAADATGQYAAKGVGGVECSKFIDAAQQGGAEALGEYAGFVAGYTSAFNENTAQLFDAWRWQSLDTVMLLLLQRCRQDGSLMFSRVVAELTRYLAQSGLPAKEDLQRVGDEKRGFYLYRSAYEELLAALKRHGYDVDNPYAALMQYRVDNDVRAGKNVHQVLLLRLIGPTAGTGGNTP